MADRPIDRQAWAKLVAGLITSETKGRKATFARLVGVDPKTIGHWLAGTVDVSESSVRRVATALGRRPLELLVAAGYYSAAEVAAGLGLKPAETAAIVAAEESPESDEEVEEILTSDLPEDIKGDLLEVLAEERERDKQRRLEHLRRLIQARRAS